MEYHIDCAELQTRAELHNALAQLPCFPQWYGRNLDALYDVLTDIAEETQLHFHHWEATADFSRGFYRTFLDAQEKNPCLQVYFHS